MQPHTFLKRHTHSVTLTHNMHQHSRVIFKYRLFCDSTDHLLGVGHEINVANYLCFDAYMKGSDLPTAGATQLHF